MCYFLQFTRNEKWKKCTPIQLIGIEPINISSAQRENLEFVFNSGFVKIFSSLKLAFSFRPLLPSFSFNAVTLLTTSNIVIEEKNYLI